MEWNGRGLSFSTRRKITFHGKYSITYSRKSRFFYDNGANNLVLNFIFPLARDHICVTSIQIAGNM